MDIFADENVSKLCRRSKNGKQKTNKWNVVGSEFGCRIVIVCVGSPSMTIRSEWDGKDSTYCLFAARQFAVCSMSRVSLSLVAAAGAAAAALAAITVQITVHNLFSATAISITETFLFTTHFVRAFAFEMGTVKFIPDSFVAWPFRFLLTLFSSKCVLFASAATDTHTHTRTRMTSTHK